MDNKIISIRKDEKEVEEVVQESTSKRKNKYEALIKAYKKQNPVKYELKKDVLKERLKNIK